MNLVEHYNVEKMTESELEPFNYEGIKVSFFKQPPLSKIEKFEHFLPAALVHCNPLKDVIKVIDIIVSMVYKEEDKWKYQHLEDFADEMWIALLDKIADKEVDEDILEVLDRKTFIPDEYHRIGSGSWVMVNGHPDVKDMTVAYAKPARRKNYDLVVDRIEDFFIKESDSEHVNEVMKHTKEYKNLKKNLEEIRKKYYIAVKQLLEDILEVKPYEIYIEIKSKNGRKKKVYLNTWQYKIIDDVQPYIDAVLKKDPHIKAKVFSNQDLDDKIFYLRSRGIRKEAAMVMCNLNHTYFEMSDETLEMTSSFRSRHTHFGHPISPHYLSR